MYDESRLEQLKGLSDFDDGKFNYFIVFLWFYKKVKDERETINKTKKEQYNRKRERYKTHFPS